jgi:hypothetical protein
MSLYTLKREYEERRQALIDQLQKNPNLDPATQHQIYGAIKEIENFLKTIEYQISTDQERNLNVALSTDRPTPFMERTSKAVYHVAHGTKKLLTHTVKGVVLGPKRYFDRKKEEKRLKSEIKAEMDRRHEEHMRQLMQTTEHVTLEHPHQELAVEHEEPKAEPIPPHPDEQMEVRIEEPEEHHMEPTPEEHPTLPTWTDDTVQKPDIRILPPPRQMTKKRPKPAPKAAVKPSLKAKKGHQHKPHNKKDKHKGHARR